MVSYISKVVPKDSRKKPYYQLTVVITSQSLKECQELLIQLQGEDDPDGFTNCQELNLETDREKEHRTLETNRQAQVSGNSIFGKIEPQDPLNIFGRA